MIKKIGISFTSHDKNKVDKLEDILSPLGIQCGRYDRHVLLKENIKQYMSIFNRSDMNIILLSKEYFFSPFCLYELTLIYKKPEKVIIIYDDSDTRIDTLLLYIKNIDYEKITIPNWLKDSLINVDWYEIYEIMVSITQEKYFSTYELLSKYGIGQLLNVLNYTPQKYINELEDILNMNDFYKREKRFDDYIEWGLKNEIYYHYKGLSYKKEGYIKGAEYYWNLAVETNPNFVSSYIQLLQLQFSDYSTSEPLDISVLDKLENSNQISVDEKVIVLHAKGLWFFEKGKQRNLTKKIRNKYLKKAIEKFDEAIKLAKESDAAAWNYKGNVYEIMGNPDEAINAYKESVSIEPSNYVALNNLALLFHRYYNDIDTAKLLFEKCLNINPNYSYAKSNYALLMENINIDEAIELDLRYVIENQPHTNYVTNLALLLDEEKGYRDISFKIFKILYEQKPNYIVTKYNYANALRRRKNHYFDVLSLLSEVNEQMPNTDMILFSLALLEYDEGHYDKAIYWCSEALNTNPNYYPAVYLMTSIGIILKQNMDTLLEKLNVTINSVDERIYDSEDSVKEVISTLFLARSYIYKCMKKETESFTDLKYAVNWNEKIKIESYDYNSWKDIGIDIIESRYNACSKSRIHKTSLVRISQDSKKEMVRHLLKLLG